MFKLYEELTTTDGASIHGKLFEKLDAARDSKVGKKLRSAAKKLFKDKVWQIVIAELMDLKDRQSSEEKKLFNLMINGSAVSNAQN